MWVMAGQIDLRVSVPNVSPAGRCCNNAKPNIHRYDGQLCVLWSVDRGSCCDLRLCADVSVGVPSASNVVHLPSSQARRTQNDVWLVLNNARQIMDIMNQSLVLAERENTEALMGNNTLSKIQLVAMCLLGAPIVLAILPAIHFVSVLFRVHSVMS